jgi:raffinose/stachyose/melibiose transport system substrate-binding protein
MNARRLPVFLGLFLLVAAFGYSLWKVARRSADAADPRTRVIRIAHWQLEAGIREAFDAMARRYEALHPGVRVEQIVVPERIFPTWVTTQLVGGTAPDLIALNSQFIGAERVARHFLPLTEAVESPNPYNVGTPLEGLPWRSTVQDGMEGSFHPELFEFYGVSPFAGTVRIYYNRALMTRLVGHERPPADFAAFEDVVRRVPELAATVGRPLVALAGSRYNGPLTLDRAVSSQTHRLATRLNPLVAMPLDPRQFAVAHLAGDWDFTAPDLLGALELARFYSRAMPPGFMQMERDDALFYFLQENALMIQSGSWDSGSVASQARFPVGVFNLPSPPPQHPVYRGAPGTVIAEGALRTTAGFGITQNSADPGLALDFLRFLVSHGGNRDFARLSGWLPVVLGAEPPPRMAAFMPVSEGFPPGPHLRAFPDSRRLFDNSLGALIGEKGDVPAFVAALAPGFASALRTDLARLQRGSIAALQRNEIALEATARLRASAVNPTSARLLDAKHAALLEAQTEIESLLAWEYFRLRPASSGSLPPPAVPAFPNPSPSTTASATETSNEPGSPSCPPPTRPETARPRTTFL